MQRLNRIIYGNDSQLLYAEYKKSRDFYIIQMFFGQIFALLTSGILLSGFAVYLGTKDMTNSIITLLPSSAAVLLIFGARYLENVSSIKKTSIIITIVSKLLICSVVTIPVFVPKALHETVFITICVTGFSIQSLAFMLINKWFISVVPDNIRGRYFAIRYSFALVVSIVLPVISGRVIDTSADRYKAFLILYGIALVAVVFEIWAFSMIEEPNRTGNKKEKFKFTDFFKLPFANKEFMKFTGVLTVFMFVLNVSNSYSAVYWIKYLELPITVVNLMGVFSAIAQFFIVRLWGRISDRLGHQYVLDRSMWLFAFEALIWMIAVKSMLWIFIPVSMLMSAGANSGFLIGAFNQRQKLIPQRGRTIYDSFYALMIGAALISASIFGGIIKNVIENIGPVSANIPFIQFRVLYLISVIGIFAIKLTGYIIYLKETDKRSRQICMNRKQRKTTVM